MNRLTRYTIGGFFFVAILGSLSHFFYDWCGKSPIVGLFSPVSESTWEHIKLLFFPMLLYSLFMSCRLRASYPCVTASLFFGNLCGCALIPVFFYTYTGILGFNLLPLDIASFLLSIAAAFHISYKAILSRRVSGYRILLAVLVLAGAAAFWIFTFFPPSIGLFYNPPA